MSTSQRPILVAYDGSPDATRALEWALDLASRCHQRLEVVVVALDPELVAPQMRPHETEYAQRAADRAREILARATTVRSTVQIRYGWVLAVLKEQAAEADLMVVGSRGHGVVENHVLGSISHHLAGHAPCTVAVVREAHHPQARTILVGIDGSEPSRRALGYACERAELTGEKVLAVYAYQDSFFNQPGLAALPENLDMSAVDAAERFVAEQTAGVAADHPDVEVRSAAVVGKPARVLARLSDDASVVVVGSRGRNSLIEIVLGSVAQETLRRAECPVVVVR